MKLVSALIGLAALGGVALSNGAASAATSTVVVPAGQACNEWGHCWYRHSGYGYDHPHHYYGGWGWRHWGYGYGYHHPHYWGGWRWRHWHRWHNWNSGS